MREDELVGSLQTYEMTLLFLRRPKGATFKASLKYKNKSSDEIEFIIT